MISMVSFNYPAQPLQFAQNYPGFILEHFTTRNTCFQRKSPLPNFSCNFPLGSKTFSLRAAEASLD